MAEPMVRPFAGLTTPRSLEARRRAESQARYANEGFWVQRAAEHGQDLKAEFARLGYGLDDEDIRAQAHEKLLASVMQDAKLAIDAGELSPDEAQGYIMQTAMTALLDAGDYEAANEIAPQLTEWQKGRLELDKIRSEIGKEQSQAYQAQATGTRQLTDARRLAARTPEEVALLQEQQETQRSIQEKNRRIDPAKPDKAPDARDLMTPTQRFKLEQQLASTLSTFQQLGGMYELVTKRPGVSSVAAAEIGKRIDQTVGFGQIFKDQLGEAEKKESAGVEQGAEAGITEAFKNSPASEGGFLGRRGTLSQEYREFRSRAIDLAYVLAKARDPGGRLSNADVDNALEILGAAGDATALRRVLERVAKDSWRSLDNLRKVSPGVAGMPGFAVIDDEYKRFTDLAKATADGELGASKPATGRSQAEKAAAIARAKKRLSGGK